MSSRLRLAALFTLGAIAFAGAARAEVTGLKFTVSPYAGFALWDQLVKYDDTGIYGGRVGLEFGRWIVVEGTYGYCPTEHTLGTPVGDSDVSHVGADLIINLTKPYTVTPYILGGWSMLWFDPDFTRRGATLVNEGKQTVTGFEGGAGVKMRLAERAYVRVEARDVVAKRHLQNVNDRKFTHNVLFTAGFHFLIGGSSADDDLDGVGNNHDKCPDTPKGATVDKSGCPSDADGDGVYDGIDQCANTPRGARVDAKGCPTDSDGDGVYDGIDQCAGTPRGARVDAKGCPTDGDNDGVPDGIDECANTPTGATVDARGCPSDSDGDGVYDGVDRCPNTPRDVRVDRVGCPIEINEKETQLLETGLLRINNINFETAKWTLKPESHAVLDEVGEILSKWPELQIEIGGHTDSQGSDAYNQTLSENRARAVMDYLQGKFPGLNKSQYSSKGYGEGSPVADNKTAGGRALNRRVEFKVLNTETLKKEIENRKMLKKD
jgi:OOP family OmpA-OmpF porin